MSYVDAIHENNTIRVVERVNGKRVFRDFPAEYTFYYDDPKGKYQTVYRTPVSKFTTNKKSEFTKALRQYDNKWEHDISPVIRCLANNYQGKTAPELNVAFFDIEVDFDKTHGFAPPSDPFNKITAITVYLQWLDELITLTIPPKHMSMETAQEIADKFDNTFIFDNEVEMIETFFDLIQDVDVISGWNSEGFDIPYMINRISRIMSKTDNKRWCLWDKSPQRKVHEYYGASYETFVLVGRVHLDYLSLYKKFTYHEMHSYSLDAIGEYEVNERKVAYEGTLDKLYNEDFEKFIAYNRQDTYLIHKIDRKVDFIALANSVVHENTVPFSAALGSVAVTEQGIINETHALGFVVQSKSKPSSDEDTKAAGAYVATPKKGLHYWIGSVDINSLYPSAIRALNMAPETIVGQLLPTMTNEMIENHLAKSKTNTVTSAWEGHFGSLEYEAVMDRRTDVKISIEWDTTGTTQYSTLGMLAGVTTLTAAEVYSLIFEGQEKWMLSANGTIFSYEHRGIIPLLLEKWYSERKSMQRTKDRYQSLKDGIELPENMSGLSVTADESKYQNLIDVNVIYEILEDDLKTKEDLKTAALEHGFNISNDTITALPKFEKELDYQIWYWDKRQHVKKILLNSLYGALLNKYCRFYDPRLGQSTTLTGRTITRHMSAIINDSIAGTYDYQGDAIIYGDTDSCYFSAWPFVKESVENNEIEWSVETATELYDSIADIVNDSFPGLMERKFHCPREFGSIIRCGREITASTGLFIKKKRYACLVQDLEGVRMDVNGKPGKLKAMGLDLKRADTPVIVQDFLKDVLMDLLVGKDKNEIFQKIRDFKREFKQLKSWEKGTPKRVNKLTYYTRLSQENTKATIPGHVRASINYNILRELNRDNVSMPINDGQKIVVCALKDNPMQYTSVAYPVDIRKLPDWFLELPFDDALMEETIVDKKLENLLSVLNWNIDINTNINNTFTTFFTPAC